MRLGDKEPEFDPDIAALQLSEGEKMGLQVFRNYTRAFEQHAAETFVRTINAEELDLDSLLKLYELVVREDERFLPIIVCAFADDLLLQSFKKVIPEGVIGGRSSLFTGYGPLASLAQRIQLGSAFDVMSPDLLMDLNRIRRVRNKISHSWNSDELRGVANALSGLHPIEQLFDERMGNDASLLDVTPDASLRIRLVWIMGRCVYEAAAYDRAKKARLRPKDVLYGSPATKWLQEIAGHARAHTLIILRQDKI